MYVGLYTPNDVQQMVQEIVKMKEFTHCHVMSMIGVCLDTSLAIVMPYNFLWLMEVFWTT